MTALTKDRATPAQLGDIQAYPVKASTTIYGGSIVCLDATGQAVPGSTATGLTCVGRAERRADNSDGANGDIDVEARAGVFRFVNQTGASNLIAAAQIGDDAYITDDQTVSKASTGRSKAGKIVQVDDQGVWVRLGL